MGDKITLKVDPREVYGKKVQTLRKQGLTPGVVYGPGMDPFAIQADSGMLRKVVAEAGTYTPVHLTGAKQRIAMVKSVDIDPTKNSIRHISFHAVKANEPVIAEVPIRLAGEGESEAERAGLVVLQALDKLELKALPMDLPDGLEVSILELAEVGDRLTVGDIKLPKGVEIVDNDDGRKADDDEEEQQSITDLVIASVYEPGALQAANEAAGGDAEDASADNVGSDHGEDTDQTSQAEESRPGGKGQDEPKQSNVDANK